MGAPVVFYVCIGSWLLAYQHSPLISITNCTLLLKLPVGKRAGSGPLPSLIPTVHHSAPSSVTILRRPALPLAGSTDSIPVTMMGT